MKTSIKNFALGLFLTTTIFSCSKKNDGSTNPASHTTWTISGNSYTGTTTVFTNNQLLSVAGSAAGQPDIGIQFNARPSTNGTYTVVNGISAAISANQCAIQTSNASGGSVLFSYNGGTVNVSINNGKITASYSNVAMGSETGFDPNNGFQFAAAGTSTGKLIEQ